LQWVRAQGLWCDYQYRQLNLTLTLIVTINRNFFPTFAQKIPVIDDLGHVAQGRGAPVGMWEQ